MMHMDVMGVGGGNSHVAGECGRMYMCAMGATRIVRIAIVMWMVESEEVIERVVVVVEEDICIALGR